MLKRLPAVIFPPRCASCRTYLEIPSSKLLCDRCRSDIKLLTGPKCKICAKPFASPKGPDHLCGDCQKKAPPFSAAGCLFSFEKTIRSLLHRYKYQGDAVALRALVSISGKTMKRLLPGFLTESAPAVILPVPMHRSRLRRRGYNHAVVLANRIFNRNHVCSSLLYKTRRTESQTGLSLKERKRNVRDSFGCRPLERMDRKVIIFDDVFTTGATVTAAALAVKKAGARDIRVITLARTPLE